jgi:hypothetical protein
MTGKNNSTNNRVPFTVFVIAAISYIVLGQIGQKFTADRLPIQSEDTVPSIFTSVAIVEHGALYLDSYYQIMVLRYPNPDDKDFKLGLLPFYVKQVGPHYLSAFPIITPILAVPFYAVAKLVVGQFTWASLIFVSHVAASVIMAAAVAFFYLLVLRCFRLDVNKSLLITAIYACATINLPLVSQALWQHGTLQLFLILFVYFLLGYLETKRNLSLFLAGLMFGLAVLSRPTGILAGLLFMLLLVGGSPNVKYFSKQILIITLGLLPCLLFFIWYNAAFYQSIANQGYSSQLFRNWLGDFPLSFFGVWLSPSKGILVYSPIFIFSIFGFAKSIKGGPENRKFRIFGLIVLIHTIVISFWKHWFGGWSFGYRMSSDIIPFMVLLLVPWFATEHSRASRVLFTVLFTLSVFVQLSGLVFFDGVWHAAYDRGFTDTSWLWSIKDSEAAFNIRRVLVKAGLLTKACPQCLPQ